MPEKPHKCDNCGNELLYNVGVVSRWNALLHTGGPSQQPTLMATGWAFYKCLVCGFEAPWKKSFVGGSRELRDQYNELMAIAREKYDKNKNIEEKISTLNNIIESTKELSSLPGGNASIEAIADSLVQPLLDQIEDLKNKIEGFEQEMKRRRGGRPPKGKQNTK